MEGMSPWTLMFQAPDVEDAYRKDRESRARRLMAIYGGTSMLLWASFSLWDWVFVPGHFAGMAALRHGIGTLGLAAATAIAVLAPEGRVGWVDRAMVVGAVSVLASTLAMHGCFLDETAAVLFAGLSIIVLTQHAFLTSRLVVVAPLTITATLAYFVIGAAGGMGPKALANNGMWLMTAEILAIFINHAVERLTRITWEQQRTIAAERARSEELLLNVLPQPVAERLKSGESPIADHVASVTVLFGDIVGFTSLSQQRSPEALVSLLDAIFRELDGISARHGLEKIKTIGDAYMAVAGLHEGDEDHAERAAHAALAMRGALASFEQAAGVALSMRIGLHTGPVVAGVIGTKKFSYDIWGDTVNTASRMESHGLPGEVQVSDEVAKRIAATFELTPRGEIDVKGKGRMTTWLVVRAR